MSQCKKLVQRKNLSTEAGQAMQKEHLGGRENIMLLQERKCRIKLCCLSLLTVEEIGISASLIMILEK